MMRCLVLVAAFFCATSALAAGPATTNNDDSCDIALQPAATTLFTIQNVSRYPQIAHVVLWTDWSFPALDFNVFSPATTCRGSTSTTSSRVGTFRHELDLGCFGPPAGAHLIRRRRRVALSQPE